MHTCIYVCIFKNVLHVCVHIYKEKNNKRLQAIHKMYTSPAATFITCGVKPCPALPASNSWKLGHHISIVKYT